MTDKELWEQELIAMGEDLRRLPSVAANVMREIANPAASAVVAEMPNDLDAALDDVRLRPDEVHITRRQKWGLALGTIAATAAAAVFFAVLFSPVANPGSVAFAQVQERLGKVRTAKLQMQQSVTVTDATGKVSTQQSERQVFVRSDGRLRIEMPKGRVSISSEPDFKMLDIDPATSTATLTHLYAFDQKRDVITSLRSLHENEIARTIEPKSFSGQSCPGFQIEERHATLQVWVNPRTQLPVRAERAFRLLNEVPPSPDGVAGKGTTQITETYGEMQFDVSLPDKLFDVTPPVGFALTIIGKPPAERGDTATQPFVLTPLKGVGPLRFGMSEAEIMQLLGKPDKLIAHKPEIPISDDIDQMGDKPRPRGGQLFVLTEFHLLEFNSLGLILTTEVQDGLTGITCVGQSVRGAAVKSFSGSTDARVRIGSTEADIRSAYGEPDKHPSTTLLAYSKLGLQFNLHIQDRTAISMTAADGVQRSLRFEWRAPLNPLAAERALGKILTVDTDSNVVTIDLGSTDRLSKRTTFSVYTPENGGVAQGVQGIKGSIEVILIMGAHLAQARITQELIASSPIAPGDPIYTAAWSPKQNETFALVGTFDFNGDGRHDEQLLIEMMETNGAQIGARVDQNGVRNSRSIDRKTKFLVVGRLPDPAAISKPEERRIAEAINGYHDVMCKEARELGVAVVSLKDFLSWMGYRPQHKLYKVGDHRPNRLPGSRTSPAH